MWHVSHMASLALQLPQAVGYHLGVEAPSSGSLPGPQGLAGWGVLLSTLAYGPMGLATGDGASTLWPKAIRYD